MKTQISWRMTIDGKEYGSAAEIDREEIVTRSIDVVADQMKGTLNRLQCDKYGHVVPPENKFLSKRIKQLPCERCKEMTIRKQVK